MNNTLQDMRDKKRRGLDDLKSKKLSTEDVHRIIRESQKPKEDVAFSDVPSAQPPSRPFVPATPQQIQDASMDFGNRAPISGTVGVQARHPTLPVNGNNYYRAVLGDKYIQEQRKGKSTPLSRFSQALRRV